MNPASMHLKDLVDTRIEQPPIWVAYPGSDTFKVLVRPLGNRNQEFIEAAQKIDWDLATMTRKVVVDQEQYLKLFCDWVIVDWSGLSLSDLRTLVLIDLQNAGKWNAEEIGCDEGAKLILMNHSPVFNTWINRVTRDVERFNLEREEAAKKKSSRPSASGSTTRESTACSALKTTGAIASSPSVAPARSSHGTSQRRPSWPCMTWPLHGASLNMSGWRQRLTTWISPLMNAPCSGGLSLKCTAA